MIPALVHVMHLEVTVGDGIDVGRTPAGVRRSVPITGGRVSGPCLTGRVLPGGADLELVRSDTDTVVHARYALESDDGEIVLVENVGLRVGAAEDVLRRRRDEPVDPARIYFRTTPTFETAVPRLSRLNSHVYVYVYVGSGIRLPHLVLFDVFEVQ